VNQENYRRLHHYYEQFAEFRRNVGTNVNVVVNVIVNLYVALSHSASNVLNAPNTAETGASSTGDRSWRC